VEGKHLLPGSETRPMSEFSPTPPSADPLNAPKNVGLPEAISRAFRRNSQFTGRASRSEYWWFMLVFFVASAVTWGLAALALLAPALALTSRRIQDTGRSAQLYFRLIKGFVGLAVVGVVVIIGHVIFQFIKYGDEGSPEELSANSSSGFFNAWDLGLVACLAFGIYWLILTSKPSTSGANEYGPGLQ